MAMVYCRECKKEVSDAAATCPHCGIAEPGKGARPKPTAKDGFVGLLIFGAIISALVYACSGGSDKTETPADPPAPSVAAVVDERPDFGITPAQFIAAYNAALKAMPRVENAESIFMPEPRFTPGKEFDAYRIDMEEDSSLYYICNASKQTGKINGLTIAYGGNGGNASQTLLSILSVTMAVRHATGSQKLSQTVPDILGEAARQMKNPKSETKTRKMDGYQLAGVGLPGNGILLMVTKDEEKAPEEKGKVAEEKDKGKKKSRQP